MKFEPQKVFIGLVDVYSILRQNTPLKYLLIGEVGPIVPGEYSKLSGAQTLTAFLFATYLFGPPYPSARLLAKRVSPSWPSAPP